MADSVTITDNRTGESAEIPIIDGGIASAEFSKLLPGIWFYDPGLSATAGCESAITYIDGDAGILEYRGYPIDQLAEHSTYLEVAYLLLHGDLPTTEEMSRWTDEITHHTFIHENMRKRFLEGFHYDAHPMGMLVSAVAALSTFYPEAKEVEDPGNRYRQIVRLIAKMPTLAAAAYRFSIGQPFVYPDNELSFPENFLSMMWKIGEPRYDAESGARAGDGHLVHPARRPRAELLDDGDAGRRLEPRRPVLGVRRGLRGFVRAAPRRCERGRRPHAHRDRHARQRRALRAFREGGTRSPAGIWAPRLQEL